MKDASSVPYTLDDQIIVTLKLWSLLENLILVNIDVDLVALTVLFDNLTSRTGLDES